MSIEDASLKEFQQWLKDTGRGWSEIAFAAWKAARQSSQSEPVYLLSVGNSLYEKVMPENVEDLRKYTTVETLYAAPQQAIPSGWWAIIMETAASLEVASYSITDPDAKKAAQSACKWARDKANELSAAPIESDK
jgi:hypothetical protein